MPSKSVAQQRLMGMAYALKKGELDPKDTSVEVKDLADSMTLKDLKDFASTKHKDLPERKVKESSVNRMLGTGTFPQFYGYTNNISAGALAAERDFRDPLVQRFMEFIDGKKKKTKDEVTETIVATAPSGVAAPQNTPGMGNVSPPSAGNVGSGDKFGEDEEDDENKERVGLLSYEDYKKWIKKWQKQNRQNQENT